MNARIPTMVLLSALGTTLALAGDRGASPAPRAADAQVQAARLLKHEAIWPTAAREPIRANSAAVSAQAVSAQTQAARLLTGEPSFTSAPQYAAAAMQPGRWTDENRAGKDGPSRDAQAQAQRLLRAQSPQGDEALEMHVVAVSH